MDTENLRLFVLASELLNISAAGRQLGMAPAVSSAKLAKLEHQLDAELLHRSTRKVSLSLEGEEFLPFAREIIAQEEAAFAALEKARQRSAAHCDLRRPAHLPSSISRQFCLSFSANNPISLWIYGFRIHSLT